MIAELAPYPSYKGSSVPWLGEVPQHWEVRRLSAIGGLSKGNGGSKEDEVIAGVPCIRYGDLYTTHTFFIQSSRSFLAPERAEDYTPVHFGDVLFAASGETIDEIGKSAVNLIQSEARCGGDVILFRPKLEVNARYMGYATDCRPAAAQKASFGRGITVKHIYGDKLKYLAIALPPLSEQSAIVRFLDYVDRRIRRYIRAKQKLIKLLEEQKQAIIHRAVTRGLDPGVRLKPSRVEWLGEVPEHWEVRQVSSVSNVVRGGSPRPAGSPVYFNGTVEPWITVSEITKDSCMHLVSTSSLLTAEGVKRSRTIEKGTLLLTNSGATLGIPKISTIRGCINDGVAALLRLRPTVNREFLYFYLATQTAHLKAWVDLGAQPNLNTQIIGGWPVPLPPIDEQAKIAEHVQRAIPQLARGVGEAAQTINLLREYRTRLIADVVTGKLDVREAAARLPDESEESESFDDIAALTESQEDADDADLAGSAGAEA